MSQQATKTSKKSKSMKIHDASRTSKSSSGSARAMACALICMGSKVATNSYIETKFPSLDPFDVPQVHKGVRFAKLETNIALADWKQDLEWEYEDSKKSKQKGKHSFHSLYSDDEDGDDSDDWYYTPSYDDSGGGNKEWVSSPSSSPSAANIANSGSFSEYKYGNYHEYEYEYEYECDIEPPSHP